jgi:hypothetical protein
MNRSRRSTLIGATTFVVATLSLTACSGSSNTSELSVPTKSASVASAVAKSAGPTYSSKRFVVPFDTATPTWKPGPPTQEQPNFVTWVAPDESQAIRFVVPVTVFKPGTTTEVPVPDPASYLGYLMGQSAKGAHFADVTKITVGGQPSTELTATTNQSLNGSLGCQKRGLAPPDCYGLQPDVSLRMAVIPRGSRTLLVWLRTDINMAEATRIRNVKAFDAILTSIKFSDRAVATTPVAVGKTALDGTWQAKFTKKELAASPLLMAPDEVNDDNWGTLTLSFKRGSVTSMITNPAIGTQKGTSTYTVAGDVLTLYQDNGETFVLRWTVNGDLLTLKRDEALGVGPTPLLVKPFIRQH